MQGVSPRRKQVIKLLLRGYSNVKIAKEMKITLNGVKQHLNYLFVLYGVRRRDNKQDDGARIRLAVKVIYENNPNLIPFHDGDRAAQCGKLSAKDHISAESNYYNGYAKLPISTIRSTTTIPSSSIKHNKHSSNVA